MGEAAAWIITALVAWLGVNLVAIAAGARIARLRRVDAGASGSDERVTPPPPHATPADDGYASLLLTRLVVHARRMLGVDQAILLLRGQGQPNRLIVVAAHGTEEDVVGRAIPIRGALGGLVSDRPLRHGPLEEVVPDGGAATAITAAAAAPATGASRACRRPPSSSNWPTCPASRRSPSSSAPSPSAGTARGSRTACSATRSRSRAGSSPRASPWTRCSPTTAPRPRAR